MWLIERLQIIRTFLHSNKYGEVRVAVVWNVAEVGWWWWRWWWWWWWWTGVDFWRYRHSVVVHRRRRLCRRHQWRRRSEGCRSRPALECLLDTVVDVLTVFLAQSLMCQKAAAVDQLLSVCWTQTSTFWRSSWHSHWCVRRLPQHWLFCLYGASPASSTVCAQNPCVSVCAPRYNEKLIIRNYCNLECNCVQLSVEVIKYWWHLNSTFNLERHSRVFRVKRAITLKSTGQISEILQQFYLLMCLILIVSVRGWQCTGIGRSLIRAGFSLSRPCSGKKIAWAPHLGRQTLIFLEKSAIFWSSLSLLFISLVHSGVAHYFSLHLLLSAATVLFKASMQLAMTCTGLWVGYNHFWVNESTGYWLDFYNELFSWKLICREVL